MKPETSKVSGDALSEQTAVELLGQVIHDQQQQLAATQEKLRETELDLREARLKLETTRGLVVDTREHRSELLIMRSILQDWIWRLNRMAGVQEDK
jgi:hypothetical protein